MCVPFFWVRGGVWVCRRGVLFVGFGKDPIGEKTKSEKPGVNK